MEFKGILSRFFVFGSFGGMLCLIIFFINPMNQDQYKHESICYITALKWDSAECQRDASRYHLYLVPRISGQYIKMNGRPSIASGTVFHVNATIEIKNFHFLSKDQQNVDNNYENGPNLKAFLYDDLSNHPLLDCSAATMVTTKKILVQYLPFLAKVLNASSPTQLTPTSYPLDYFNCTINGGEAYLYHTKIDKLYIIPFLISFFMWIFGLFLVHTYDEDGPIKEFCEFLLGFVYIFLMLLHSGCYFLFFFIIQKKLLRRQVMTIDESFDRGSIFIPLIWLFKKVISCCRPCSLPVTPASSPDTTSTSPPTRRSSVAFNPPAEVNTRPHAPPFNQSPPSYSDIKDSSVVIPNLTLYDADVEESGILPPPPSYDDVVRNDR